MKSTLRESGLNRIRNNGTMRTHSLTQALWRWIVGTLMLGALLFLGPFGSTDAAAPSMPVLNQTNMYPGVKIGMAAPQFKLKDQYGKTHTLADYKGKVILLVFEATWCPDCVKEMPALQNLHERFSKEGNAAVVIGVMSPTFKRTSKETEVKAFLKEKGQTYPVLMDRKDKLFDAYGVKLIPTNIVIDKDGTVAEIALDTTPEETLEQLIRQTQEK